MTKICIVATSFGKGGAERFSAMLSVLLEGLGYDVHIMLTKNIVSYNYSGTLFTLESNLNNSKSGFSKMLILKKYLNKNKFDFIIDNRPRSQFLKELVLYKYVFNNSNVISIIHSYNTQNYIPTNKVLAQILYKNIYRLVTVSKAIKMNIEKNYGFNNVECIYNPIDFDFIEEQRKSDLDLPKNYILYYGRIEERVKNFNLLLNGYDKSTLKAKGLPLVILGDGPDIDFIKKRIKELKLSKNVLLFPFTSNPFPYVSHAKFTVLTSRYEGFPMSIIESLACGTPVVSVDCESGPKEVVNHRENGLLVDNHDDKAFAKAMDLFVDDNELYLHCKRNTIKSVKHLDINDIASQWQKIIEAHD